MPGRPQHCFVYVITARGQRGTFDTVKIGVSRNPRLRTSGLLAGSPTKLKLFGTVKCRNRDEAFRIEGDVHKRMKPIRVHGEWFACCPYQALQIVTMIRDQTGIERVGQHVECQRLYNLPDYAGDEAAEELRQELKAAGVWRPALIDEWEAAKAARVQPVYTKLPIAA